MFWFNTLRLSAMLLKIRRRLSSRTQFGVFWEVGRDTGRPTPIESSHLSVGWPGGRSGHCRARRAHRSTGRSTGLVHRSTVICLGLLHAPFLLLLIFGLCVIFLYLFYLLSPYIWMVIGVRIMTCRDGWLMSDLTDSFFGYVLSPSWIQVSFILLEGVCLELREFYGV